MKRFLILSLYNLILPIVFYLGFPAWLVKMLKRGGYGTGLLERFGIFEGDADFEPSGSVYIHAVSVGEVMIALKLIHQWRELDPQKRFLLVPTTATGHAVASERSPNYVRVIYSPLDFILVIQRVFRRFEPSQIVLIEAEAWPNLLHQAHKAKIPVSMVNARLSPRSRNRFLKFHSLISPIFSLLRQVCIQDEEDRATWEALGLPSDNIHHTGSIKFDPLDTSNPRTSEEFGKILQKFGDHRKVIMALSTHENEELWIGETIRNHFPEALFVPVPRHFERAPDVKQQLSTLGYEVIQRSGFKQPQDPTNACFLIDSTGELKTWTAHADIVIIGKSILGKGGQNPTEAIAASVPVIIGPSMENFQPLVDTLLAHNAIQQISTQKELKETLQKLLVMKPTEQTIAAKKLLHIHSGATLRSIDILQQAGKP